MNESIHKYFQVSTVQWMSHPGLDALESIRKIACDDYFDAVEVRHFPSHGERERAKALLEQSRLAVYCAAQPSLLATGLNPNDTDEAGRLEAEKLLLAALDEAEYLGSGSLAFMAGRWKGGERDRAFGQLLKTTRALCGRAAQKGMTVALEVFDYDLDKCALIGPAPLAAEFAAAVRADHKNFGLLVDLSHIPATHETPQFVLRTLGPYVVHLHCGNAVVRPGREAYGDRHPRFGFPGGANDLPELTAFLRAAREQGLFRPGAPLPLSFEVAPWGGEDADAVLANCKRVLNRAWAMLEG